MPGLMSDRDLIDSGFVPGMPGCVLGPLDKRDAFVPIEGQPEDIWEEADGIRSHYQGSTLLITEPLLWGPFLDWRLSGNELSRCDLESMSGFEVDAVYTMAHARNRRLFPKAKANG